MFLISRFVQEKRKFHENCLPVEMLEHVSQLAYLFQQNTTVSRVILHTRKVRDGYQKWMCA